MHSTLSNLYHFHVHILPCLIFAIHQVTWEHDTLIHFTPKFQSTFAKYWGTFKAFQLAYENEMDVLKYSEDNLKATFRMR
jgi:hypothetical protein